MFTEILSDTAGQAALSRFFTTNTWNAQQIFKGSATTTPGAVFQAFGTTSAIPAIDANGIAIFQGAEATVGHVQFSASGSTTHVVFRRNNGTYASPTALASGDVIGSLQWQGRGASTFGTVPAAQIRGVTTQAFTEAARGTALEFYVTANGSITQNQTFVIEAALTYSLNALQGFASVRSNANAGTVRDFRLSTAASTRWALFANATAEGGSAAGSDLELRRYSDAAADLGLVMAVTRSTGNITFNGGGGTTTFSANQIAVSTAQTPASATAAGTTGTICWDASYIYVCTATNTWKRVAIATWP